MDRGSSVMSAQAYNEVAFIPSAMLRLPEEESQKQVYIGLVAAQNLFQNESISEVFFGKLSEEEVKRVELFGKARGMELVSGREMHSMLYRMFNSEKWISFAILSFVLLLITFNLIGALSLLVIEKQRDFRLFYRLGMREFFIQFLVFVEGLMVAFAGTLLGILLGVGLVLLQDRYGWVKTESTFTMAYPVELRLEDLGWISLLTFVLGGLSAILPSIRAKKIATTNIILDK
jgi:lipoprotein-releasing system permease protein